MLCQAKKRQIFINTVVVVICSLPVQSQFEVHFKQFRDTVYLVQCTLYTVPISIKLPIIYNLSHKKNLQIYLAESYLRNEAFDLDENGRVAIVRVDTIIFTQITKINNNLK